MKRFVSFWEMRDRIKTNVKRKQWGICESKCLICFSKVDIICKKVDKIY